MAIRSVNIENNYQCVCMRIFWNIIEFKLHKNWFFKRISFVTSLNYLNFKSNLGDLYTIQFVTFEDLNLKSEIENQLSTMFIGWHSLIQFREFSNWWAGRWSWCMQSAWAQIQWSSVPCWPSFSWTSLAGHRKRRRRKYF